MKSCSVNCLYQHCVEGGIFEKSIHCLIFFFQKEEEKTVKVCVLQLQHETPTYTVLIMIILPNDLFVINFMRKSEFIYIRLI